MKFADNEAEEYYKTLFDKYGYIHVNSKEDITVEALKDVERVILEIEKEEGSCM